MSLDPDRWYMVTVQVYKNTGSTGGSLYCKFIELDNDGTFWDIGETQYAGGLNG
ncbi:MAG: hypothetical protein ABFR90_05260 [Planctomycetota bacterium]